jgi:prolyl oligopeptidase
MKAMKRSHMNYLKLRHSVICALMTALMLLLVWACGGSDREPRLPETQTMAVVDTLHGVEIVDSYRWLEDGEDPDVQKWADKQNEYCRHVLAQYPGREKLEGRIRELMKIGTVSEPAIHGGRYFYMRRDGDMQHSRLLLKRAVDAEPEVVLDPGTFSTDGTVALDWWYPSDDGKFIAYGKSSGGTENSTLFILDADTKELLPDTIPYTDAASIAWLKDNSGFYYTRQPEPGTVPEGDEDYYRKVFFHKMGRDYRDDPLIFGEGRDKTDWPGVQLSPDNRYLLIPVYQGWAKSELYLKDLKKGGDFILLTGGIDAMFSASPLDDALYVFTNYRAPRYRIAKASYDKPQMKHWKEVIPEGESMRESYAVIGDNIVVTELHNASSRASIYSKSGKLRGDIRLPSIGSIMSYGDHVLGAETDGSEVLFGFHSYFIPPTIFRYDFRTDTLDIFDRIETDLDLSNFKAEQVWFPSKDSTMVSMFLIHRKDLVLDGNNPTLVYGYGGFASNETPYFSRTNTIFFSRGGVLADVQLRGGGEYGEEWHRAGMLENKQNVFDDFIAAMEWLIENKYTNPKRLIIEGGSNGGLLVGAVMVQRPDLMKAVVCGRPLLDMLRYHKFLIGELWVPELGSAHDPEQFEYLYAYSPYHNVKQGMAYPAVLFESADHDTRVDPMHVRKMTATLQAATSSDEPILLRIQRKTGHGQGAPISIVIEEIVDSWSFIFWQLGI